MATKRDSRPHSTTAPGISRVQTQPFASKPDSSPPDACADDPGSEREFDPFRFAVTELPTGMRQELIATKLPVVPAEQLFDTKPPNARLAAPSPVEGPSIPDSLPAVDSGQALAIPVRSNQLLLLGVVALFVFAVALALVLRSGSTTAVSPPAVSNPEYAKPEPTAKARAVPEQNAEPAEPNVASSAAAPSKPIPPASPSEPKAKSSPGQAAAPGHTTSSSEHSQARQVPSTPISDQAAPPPKKESALRSVLAPPPD